MGFLIGAGASVQADRGFRYLVGNALEPREGRGLIGFIVNDGTPNWGAGFARALAQKWPQVQESFREHANADRDVLALGRIHASWLKEELAAVALVAQHGYGRSETPRLREEALRACLDRLAGLAQEHALPVHLPRIGTGQGGGNWQRTARLIEETLVARGIHTTVYALPGAHEDPEDAEESEKALRFEI
jgi:O-acetyl-ADP-ribose deacetylase (regulator of RNase III)